MGMSAKFEGRAELTRRLEALVPGVTENVAKAKLEIAEEAAKRIAAAAPRKSGEYAASIKGERQADNDNANIVGHAKSEDPDATGVYGAWYWHFIEFGTKPHSTLKNGYRVGIKKASQQTGKGWHPGTPKKPHVYPTWRSYKPKAKRKIADAINRYIREHMKK